MLARRRSDARSFTSSLRSFVYMVGFSILLPSAEGKESGGNPFAPDMFDYRTSDTFNYFSRLNHERRALIDALHAHIDGADDDTLQKLFGVQGTTLEAAVRANLNVYDSPLMSAIERYGPGVMYKSIDFQALPTGAQRRLLENGIIFSGLFGILRPDDLIPEYKLKMDASVDEIGRVSSFWKPILSPALNEALAGKFVWNLLPGVHQAAWDDDGSYRAMVQVKFYRQDESGERKAVTHGVKELRGALVGFIVQDVTDSIEGLADWEAPDGYELDMDATEFDDATKTGTVVLVQYPDWEARRAAREAARLEEEANKPKRVRRSDDEDENEQIEEPDDEPVSDDD
ncbi:MAG: peroxide stress protein YaaA [Bacteroidota bacterium]